MMIDALNATLDREFALSDQMVRTAKAAPDPYSMMTRGGGGFFDSDSEYESANEQQERYDHYRGRFYSAARIPVQRMASQPFYVGRRMMRRTARPSLETKVPPTQVPAWIANPDTVELLDVHPLVEVMSDPNPYMTAFNMWEMFGASIFATGRGFLVAMYREGGRPFDIFPVPATWMTPVDDQKSFRKQWAIAPPGSMKKPIIVDDSQVAQMYFADPSNPARALSPMVACGRAVLVSDAIDSTQYAEFKNGPVPKVALIAGDVMNETGFADEGTSSARPVRLEPHQRRQIISWFRQQFSNLNKFGMPIVLDAIIRDIKILSRKPAEMAFMESSSMTRDQIDETIGVSKILRGQLDNTSRASGVLAEQFMVDYTANPLITGVSQVITKKFGKLFALKGENLLAWMAPIIPRDVEADLEFFRTAVRAYAVPRDHAHAILRTRFPFLPQVTDWSNVAIPQTMDIVDLGDDRPGIGRMSFPDQNAAPAQQPAAASATSPASNDGN